MTDAARRGTTAWRAVSDSPPSHKPGEFGYDDPRRRDGFDRLSFVITETQQNGGPPLHTHTVEEAHAVLSGMVGYVIGDQRSPRTVRVSDVPTGILSKRRDYTEVTEPAVEAAVTSPRPCRRKCRC